MRRQHPITGTLAIAAALTIIPSTLYAGDIIVDAGQGGVILKKCMGNDNPTRSSNLNKMYMNYTITSFDDMVAAVQRNFPNSYKCYLTAKSDVSKAQASGANEPVSQSSVNQPADTRVQVPTQATSVGIAGQPSGSMQSSSGSEKLLSKCLVNYNGDVGRYLAETHDKDAAEAIDKIMKDRTNYMYSCLMPIVRGSKVYTEVFAKATDGMKSCISSKIGFPPFDPNLVDAVFDKCIDYPRSSAIWDVCLTENKTYTSFANCFTQKINASPRRVPSSVDNRLITGLNNSVMKIADAVNSGLATDKAALTTNKVIWAEHTKSIQTCVASKGTSCETSGAEGAASHFIGRWTYLSQLQPRVKECVGDLYGCYMIEKNACSDKLRVCEVSVQNAIAAEQREAEERQRQEEKKIAAENKEKQKAEEEAEKTRVQAERERVVKERILAERAAAEEHERKCLASPKCIADRDEARKQAEYAAAERRRNDEMRLSIAQKPNYALAWFEQIKKACMLNGNSICSKQCEDMQYETLKFARDQLGYGFTNYQEAKIEEGYAQVIAGYMRVCEGWSVGRR